MKLRTRILSGVGVAAIAALALTGCAPAKCDASAPRAAMVPAVSVIPHVPVIPHVAPKPAPAPRTTTPRYNPPPAPKPAPAPQPKPKPKPAPAPVPKPVPAPYPVAPRQQPTIIHQDSTPWFLWFLIGQSAASHGGGPSCR